jgi:hypothetical protein
LHDENPENIGENPRFEEYFGPVPTFQALRGGDRGPGLSISKLTGDTRVMRMILIGKRPPNENDSHLVN